MRKTGWAVAALIMATTLTFASQSAIADPSKPPLPPPPGASLPGADAPPAGVASWADLMATQARLDAAADRISAARDNNYTGIAISAQTNAITVYWKGGRPSAAASTAIDAARGDAASVQVLDAKYSESHLLKQAERLARTQGVTGVSANVDGSGLSVSVASNRRGGPPQADVPITQIDTADVQAAYSRWDDSPPYWGGAVWQSAGGRCSTGFAIAIGGVSKMLSAGHCGANGGGASDGGGQYMGTISGDTNAYDTLYINTSSAGRIYDGGVGTGEFSKPVIGASHSYVGNWLCTSGAYSGARCNEQVIAVNVTIWVGYYIYGMVRAEQVNHTNAVGNGDSGGPVFALSADPNKVIAKGTVSAIDTSTSVACTGIPAGNGRTCAWRFYYADVVNSLNRYGAAIVTG